MRTDQRLLPAMVRLIEDMRNCITNALEQLVIRADIRFNDVDRQLRVELVASLRLAHIAHRAAYSAAFQHHQGMAMRMDCGDSNPRSIVC